jgi:hypothetical protein
MTTRRRFAPFRPLYLRQLDAAGVALPWPLYG